MKLWKQLLCLAVIALLRAIHGEFLYIHGEEKPVKCLWVCSCLKQSLPSSASSRNTDILVFECMSTPVGQSRLTFCWSFSWTSFDVGFWVNFWRCFSQGNTGDWAVVLAVWCVEWGPAFFATEWFGACWKGDCALLGAPHIVQKPLLRAVVLHAPAPVLLERQQRRLGVFFSSFKTINSCGSLIWIVYQIPHKLGTFWLGWWVIVFLSNFPGWAYLLNASPERVIHTSARLLFYSFALYILSPRHFIHLSAFLSPWKFDVI